jgi:hypothetical protein
VNDDDPKLTDQHMIVLAMLRDESVNGVEEAAAALGVRPAEIQPLIADLEAAGYLKAASVH